jgi:hypothetical protein
MINEGIVLGHCLFACQGEKKEGESIHGYFYHWWFSLSFLLFFALIVSKHCNGVGPM